MYTDTDEIDFIAELSLGRSTLTVLSLHCFQKLTIQTHRPELDLGLVSKHQVICTERVPISRVAVSSDILWGACILGR